MDTNFTEELRDFLVFLLRKAPVRNETIFSDTLIMNAFRKSFEDAQYRNKNASTTEVWDNIRSNMGYLPVFLYRLGSELYAADPSDSRWRSLHWIMKELCACEIYFSNKIDVGFEVVHAVGVVIGSRNKIGKGFRIYQNSTIGHRVGANNGCVIGDNVTVFAGSQILGDLNIAANTIVGANSLLLKDTQENGVYVGSPATMVSKSS